MSGKLIDKILLTQDRTKLVVYYVNGPTISINVKECSFGANALIEWINEQETERAVVHELRSPGKQAA
jgi:hypothetical protein